jgi:hypothetical protein
MLPCNVVKGTFCPFECLINEGEVPLDGQHLILSVLLQGSNMSFLRYIALNTTCQRLRFRTTSAFSPHIDTCFSRSAVLDDQSA